jgi:hypothetical protein
MIMRLIEIELRLRLNGTAPASKSLPSETIFGQCSGVLDTPSTVQTLPAIRGHPYAPRPAGRKARKAARMPTAGRVIAVLARFLRIKSLAMQNPRQSRRVRAATHGGASARRGRVAGAAEEIVRKMQESGRARARQPS